jgi:hypothetical protein
MERVKDDHDDAGGEEEDEDDLAERLAKRARHQSQRGRGWQGAALELERPNPHAGDVAIVDLEQFRNHQIGVGYQAKHVIRQPQSSAKTTTATVKSSLSKSLSLVEDNQQRDKKKDNEGLLRRGGSGRGASSVDNNSNKYKNKYLQHTGLRKLRKELEMYK